MHVALHSPADLLLAPRVRAAIATYSDVAVTAVALADALVEGPSAFAGRLPVALERGETRVQASREALVPALAG